MGCRRAESEIRNEGKEADVEEVGKSGNSKKMKNGEKKSHLISVMGDDLLKAGRAGDLEEATSINYILTGSI